jgi:hypothetical protein
MFLKHAAVTVVEWVRENVCFMTSMAVFSANVWPQTRIAQPLVTAEIEAMVPIVPSLYNSILQQRVSNPSLVRQS